MDLNFKDVKIPSVDKKRAAGFLGFLTAALLGLGGYFLLTHPRPAHAEDLIAANAQVQLPSGVAEIKSGAACDVVVTDGSSYEKAKAYAAEQGCRIRNFISHLKGDDKDGNDKPQNQSTDTTTPSAVQAPASSVAQEPATTEKHSSIMDKIHTLTNAN
jgi:hypothetical protein